MSSRNYGLWNTSDKRYVTANWWQGSYSFGHGNESLDISNLETSLWEGETKVAPEILAAWPEETS